MHQYEKIVLKALEEGEMQLGGLAAKTNITADAALRACYWLKEKNAVEIKEEVKEERALSGEASAFLKDAFPEQQLIEKINEARGALALERLSKQETAIGIPWAKRNEWVEFKEEKGKKKIALTAKGKKALKGKYALLEVLKKISGNKKLSEKEREAAKQLEKRTLVTVKQSKNVRAQLTEEGKKLAKSIIIEQEVNVLTREIITGGNWRNVAIRPYDVEAPVEKIVPGKEHPLRLLIKKIRGAFVEMGFEEMAGSEVESAFWNFDALFQPQDHPARDLADTFYLKNPEKFDLPEEALVKRVKEAHEKGWGYKWDGKPAQQAVLRTHTTAVSARYLADTRKGERKEPAKYFSIGRVYRNEATDFKHLAEFHQVEGIVVWEDASFRNLLGCLKQFYSKLGFEKIRFRPSYFPYTEPSLEIDAFFETKNAWLELGGAGILRPEVCLPLWGKYPVLAWGLSLERPLMLMTGLGDIRTPYRNDLKWLRESKIGDSRWLK